MAKLILTNEVAGLGSAGDVIEVKNGYARNYLIPQGFAVAWTRGGEKQVASIRAARDARAIHDHEEAVALKDALEANKVKLPSRPARKAACSAPSSPPTSPTPSRLPVWASSTSARSTSPLRSRPSASTRRPFACVTTSPP
jgi:hypothetical protein